MVFEVTVNNKYKKYNKTNKYYWSVKYPNMIITPDGNLPLDQISRIKTSHSYVIDSNQEYSFFMTKCWYYDGFKTLDDLKKIVQSEREKYTIEDNVIAK